MNRRSSTILGLGLVSSLLLTACPDNGSGGAGGSGNEGGSGGAGNAGGAGGQGGGGGSLGCIDPTRMDLVLALDNSRSMADKQAILALTVPELVNGLVNPPCFDPSGVAAPVQPATPADACPGGLVRAFAPLTDIHVGVLSSSLGGHGSDSCPDVDPISDLCSPNPNFTNNDKAHLLARTDACSAANVPTYASKGFLAWDPAQILMPPGESQINDGMGGGLAPRLREMVNGVGQIGCGYESQLESIYRFLADPEPYATITVVNAVATPSGIDSVLLQERAAFLRPDSLLAVLMLTDENDCSTKEYGQFYYVNQLRNGATNVRLPRARAICATNPDDECCKSCGQAAGNCPVDSTCEDLGGGPALLTAEEDSINLRCWEQKRRFGIDFLYPIDRYTQAFSSATITNRAGEIVPNPIFQDLDPSDGISEIRGAQQVFFSGLVGVPWQDIAVDKTDIGKGFKSPAELAMPLPDGKTTWDVILGDPAMQVKALDPLMVESVAPRTGTNPITGDPLIPAGSPTENPINGHEWTIDNDDLQYACVFNLLPSQQRDCTKPNLTACDCFGVNNDNPLCAQDPNNNNAPTLQVKAKAYPGLRPIALMKSLGDQAVLGSVCPADLTQANSPAYGYRPLVTSVVKWISRRACQSMP